MTHAAGKTMALVGVVFSLLLGGAAPVLAAGETMYDYTKVPPFIEVGLNPNLLMLIDNSASMYDPAYAPANQNYCFAGVDGASSIAAYDGTVSYAGYLDPGSGSWYTYNAGSSQFASTTAAAAATACSGATGDKYTAADLCYTVNVTSVTPYVATVTAFAAKGRFLNWLASSKFDVEKKILTGGKYDATHAQMVMESRGCLENRFIKKVPMKLGATTYYATFGVRPPTNIEKLADTAYNGAVSNTRIEIFKPTTAGFSFAQCQAAIDGWTDPATGLGTLKSLTTACLEAAGTSNITASNTAFNHILQECWYYKAHGAWQPGSGTVTSLKNDCEKVYVTPPGTMPGATYVPPETLNAADVCYGQFDPAHTVGGPWGSGYAGQCWEPKTGSGFIWVDRACNPVTDPHVVAATNPYCNPGDSFWYVCNYTYNASKMTCKQGSTVKPWDRQKVQVPVAGGITSVNWTDDADAGAGGATCVDYALKKYCTGIDEVTVVDATEVSDPQGTAWGIPAILVDTATLAQLGKPLTTMKGLVASATQPSGLIQEFKYNLRMGAMEFNAGTTNAAADKTECKPVLRPDGTYKASLYDCLVDKGASINVNSLPDTSKLNGGKVVSYVDDGDTHTTDLVGAINAISATAWTPLAETYFEAVGVFAQNNGLRLNPTDFICDQDYSGYPAWQNNHLYAPGSKVRFAWDYDDNGLVDETKVYLTIAGGTSNVDADISPATITDDHGVHWTPVDPVLAGCQSNNILIITDGGSTADINSTMTTFVAASGHNDGDNAVTYAAGHLEPGEFECKTAAGTTDLYGSSFMDDLSYYAHRNGSDIYSYPTVNNMDKKPLTTYVVAAGTLQDDGTTHDCNPKTQLQQVAANSETTLLESTDPSQLATNLRRVFELIGGEPASGSAASVISNSRSGEGAIFQAVFFPKQQDQDLREIVWAGDVHALWLDELGNIREDCKSGGCAAGDQDFILDKKADLILNFYTDPITNAARAKSFSDANGDGKYDPVADLVQEDINLRSIRYLWSAGEWLSQVPEAAVDSQRLYTATTKQRHILTSVNGSGMIDFTPTAVHGGLGSDTAYRGYFHAASVDEADDIISYIRGNDSQFNGATPRGYRSRLIDWDGNGTPEVWKLGDIVNSTPTVVSTPAEDYDLIYGDKSYQEFRQRYRNRRAVIYAGGNDGGMHAFNGGYYDRDLNKILKAPPGDLEGESKVEYDLGGEMWMFVPKNVFPHLKWLTDPKYVHVNYVDFKPYILDAKIFNPDTDHPQGWGTLMVGGMGFGGGNIKVDTTGDGNDDLTMRSAYFILDITNPEVPPRILHEFSDINLGYTIGSPTAVPLLLCELKVDCPTDPSVTWPMDWYLAMPSGPHNSDSPASDPPGGRVQEALKGKSNQAARIFTIPLGGTGYAGHLGYTGSFSPVAKSFEINDGTEGDFPDAFFTDVIAVDYDLNYKTDTLYFGSVANANTDDTEDHTGGMHRLVIGGDSNPDNWHLNTFFKTPGNQPVSGSPSVATDGQRAWIYFGTGRYYSAQLDKNNNKQQSFYGLKERYDTDDVMDLTLPNAANIVDVSHVWVENKTGNLHMTTGSLPVKATDYDTGDVTSLSATKFKALDREMSQKSAGLDKYNGWRLDFDLTGERNLGQAAILGNIVTFTTFQPSKDLCQPEGESFLWAPYYRTGTAYLKSVIGLTDRGGTKEVVRKVSVGIGLASTPNIHSGAEAGSTAFVQTSTGAIVSIQQTNPGVVKSGVVSWREVGD